MFIRTSRSLLLIVGIFFLVPSLAAQIKTIKNQYLALEADQATGRWSLSTSQGLPDFPSDDNHAMTGTDLNSFCVVRIDDKYYKFGGIEGRLSEIPAPDALSVQYNWAFGNIDIIQELRLTNSVHTLLPATLKVRYWVRNRDNVEHRIGLRIVLDTFLGLSDDSALIVPDMSFLANEAEFRRSYVPDYMAAWDAITAPNVRAALSYTGPNVVKPDILAFASRKRLAETKWDFAVDKQKDFRPSPMEVPDPAVSMTWEPIRFRPGTENGVAFGFGMVDASVSANIPPLDLLLLTPLTVRTAEFTVLAEFQNTDTAKSLKNLALKIELPSGMTLTRGSAEVSFPEIKPTEKRTISWHVRSRVKGPGEIKLTGVASMTGQPVLNQIKRTLTSLPLP